MVTDTRLTKIQRIVEAAVVKHGSARAAANALGLREQYLCKLRRNPDIQPSAATLAKLGLKARTVYDTVTA
jgi:hypothetical protein